MLPARRVAKESYRKGADVDSKMRETAQAPNTAIGDDAAADVPAAVDPADIVRYLPEEPVFFPREDGPAAGWLACARLSRL